MPASPPRRRRSRWASATSSAGTEPARVSRAVAAARSTLSSLGLAADEAIVLNNSNKLTLRLLPCDVVARVALARQLKAARFEVDLARKLAAAACPVAALDPRLDPVAYEADEFVITFWSYYAPAAETDISATDYANALERLHAGMRTVDIVAPNFADRVDEALVLLAGHEQTPDLPDDDRRLLGDTLRTCKRVVADHGAQQLLHGEPHPGNLLDTRHGPLFIDLETCCRGPVEFDLAHAPESVADHYPNLDRQLLAQCRILVLAMIITWRWDRTDQLPNGRQLAAEWLGQLRAALGQGRV